MCYVKKYELALPYLQKSIKENEEDGEARYFLGFCYLQIGNEAKAFEEWYSSLQILEYKDLLVTIAYEFETHGYYTAAIHCYKRLEALGFLKIPGYIMELLGIQVLIKRISHRDV
ncbi:tetratricopeptide repeat protein [Anaerobacillus sp. HL2]|nr:tetratricopeptide repeat protein [Anaerobacillus sp. HL2]